MAIQSLLRMGPGVTRRLGRRAASRAGRPARECQKETADGGTTSEGWIVIYFDDWGGWMDKIDRVSKKRMRVQEDRGAGC